MPYERTEIDLDCNISFCAYWDCGSCDTDEEVEDLRPSNIDCRFFQGRIGMIPWEDTPPLEPARPLNAMQLQHPNINRIIIKETDANLYCNIHGKVTHVVNMFFDGGGCVDDWCVNCATQAIKSMKPLSSIKPEINIKKKTRYDIAKERK